MVDFDVNMQGMDSYIRNQSYLNFSWAFDVPRQEHYSRFGEDRYTYMTYKFFEDEVDNLNKNKSDEENLSTSVKWIGFKQLFFNSTIISDEAFPNAQVRQEKYKYEDNHNYLGNFRADIAIPFNESQSEKNGDAILFWTEPLSNLKTIRA